MQTTGCHKKKWTSAWEHALQSPKWNMTTDEQSYGVNSNSVSSLLQRSCRPVCHWLIQYLEIWHVFNQRTEKWTKPNQQSAACVYIWRKLRKLTSSVTELMLNGCFTCLTAVWILLMKTLILLVTFAHIGRKFQTCQMEVVEINMQVCQMLQRQPWHCRMAMPFQKAVSLSITPCWEKRSCHWLRKLL